MCQEFDSMSPQSVKKRRRRRLLLLYVLRITPRRLWFSVPFQIALSLSWEDLAIHFRRKGFQEARLVAVNQDHNNKIRIVFVLILEHKDYEQKKVILRCLNQSFFLN